MVKQAKMAILSDSKNPYVGRAMHHSGVQTQPAGGNEHLAGVLGAVESFYQARQQEQKSGFGRPKVKSRSRQPIEPCFWSENTANPLTNCQQTGA